MGNERPKLYETWTTTKLRGRCPHCKEVNYVDLGDLNDVTAPDVEVVICWNCDQKSWIIDDEMLLDLDYDSIEDGYAEKGKKS